MPNQLISDAIVSTLLTQILIKNLPNLLQNRVWTYFRNWSIVTVDLTNIEHQVISSESVILIRLLLGGPLEGVEPIDD